jgi:hypothetical protein
MTEQERLQCHAIDIGGLNLCDRDRIEQIGFEARLDEVSDQKTAGTQITRQHRHRAKCAICEPSSWPREPTRTTAGTSANSEVIGANWRSVVRMRTLTKIPVCKPLLRKVVTPAILGKRCGDVG